MRVMPDEPRPRSLQEMVWLLRQFEGRRCLWRAPVAIAAYGAIWLLPLVGAVAGIYVGSDLRLSHVVLGTIVSLGLAELARRLDRKKPWRAVFARRLWTYEAPSPRTTLEVLVRDEDFIQAHRVLRRNKFVPIYGAQVGVPPSDATDLTVRLGVQEPVAWMRSASDEDRIGRIAAVFEAARVRARVAGRDVIPDAL